MSRCVHVYSFVARNHGGIPFSGVCPFFNHLFEEKSERILSRAFSSSAHPPVRGENVKTFLLWDHRLQRQKKTLHGI